MRLAQVVWVAVIIGVLAGCSSGGSASGTVGAGAAVGAAGASPAATTKAHSDKAKVADAAQLAAALKAQGLPVTTIHDYTAEDDGNHLLGRQGGYTSKDALQDARLPKVAAADVISGGSTDGGASIEFYPNSADAQKRLKLLMGFQGTFVGDGYDYLTGGALLRLDQKVTPDEAAGYKSALKQALG